MRAPHPQLLAFSDKFDSPQTYTYHVRPIPSSRAAILRSWAEGTMERLDEQIPEARIRDPVPAAGDVMTVPFELTQVRVIQAGARNLIYLNVK